MALELSYYVDHRQPEHFVARPLYGTAKRVVSPRPCDIPSVSAPDIPATEKSADLLHTEARDKSLADFSERAETVNEDEDIIKDFSTNDPKSDPQGLSELIDDDFEDELETRWILNLSMHFKDRSDREKFYVTYAQSPGQWLRLTISCDYRHAPPDSLEMDLKMQRYQRDKSARIYESIRESLQDIKFYTTVTNLKLETQDGRLHVHVTEDVNEIISYPPVSSISHLQCSRYRESSLEFQSHLSGFVYKVLVNGRILIKKEIPGPDAVEEFLYEVHALTQLSDSKYVIRLEGVVLDDNGTMVKGLLVTFANNGALLDLIYDEKGHLPWQRRERWALQIIHGLSEIHEAGFVQGDFTLSNIVIDEMDNAKIIDINRRGCPVGWEPPEMVAILKSNQRLSIFIGVKSDLFQLGMVLWALALEEDEPERKGRPLSFSGIGDIIPQYYRRLMAICLSDNPTDRASAKELLKSVPSLDQFASQQAAQSRVSLNSPKDN
ncbi:MAG: hypothetical protein M1825_001414 [Sarcosagium campestre]|nr:MAG: hypothetical protein M1825_001414 [Sarcosagium campestre]